MAKTKKPNAQDSTERNMRKTRRDIATLARKVFELEAAMWILRPSFFAKKKT